MARRTSDIAMLLGSSSKSRSSRGGGLTGKLVGFIDSMLGRKKKRNRRQERREQTVPILVLGIAILLAFGGGYAVGGGFGKDGDGTNPLRTTGRSPSFVDEIKTRPLASEAYIVAVYTEVAAAEAKLQAHSLSKYLISQGLTKSRPYPWPTEQGTLWVTAVYFDGEEEAAQVYQALRALPEDVPDKVFCDFRTHDIATEQGWPGRRAIPNY